MDEEDRLSYIRECKQKLGLNDRELLKSSRRAIVDQQLMKDMPVLEFNGVFGHHTLHHLQPHEMQWSAYEFLKEENQELIEKTE